MPCRGLFTSSHPVKEEPWDPSERRLEAVSLHTEVMEEVSPGLGLCAGQDSLGGGRHHPGRLETEVGRGWRKLCAHNAVYQGNVL